MKLHFANRFVICTWITLFILAFTIDGISATITSTTHTGLDDNLSYSMRHISIAQGLPSNVITAIVKDKRGFIWLGTPMGLCRWDGFKAIIYQHDDTDSNSLIGDEIPRNGLILDNSTGELVVGTKEGISIFDTKTGLFENHVVNPKNNNALPAPVNNVFVDRQSVLWVGTDQGFSRFRKDKNDFINYTYDHQIPERIILGRNSINHIFDIKQDYYNDPVLWMATLAGLLKFDKSTEKLQWFYFHDTEYLRDNNLLTLLVPHPNGNLYIGTWNLDMLVFNTQLEKFTGRHGPAAPGINKLANRILPYGVKSKTELWISSLQGFGVLNTVSSQIIFMQSFENEKRQRFLPELFYVDDKHFWLGSEYGVYVMNHASNLFSNHFFEPLDEEHWYLANCIFEDTLGRQLLIGYGRGEGLHSFNMDSKRFGVSPYARKSINEYNLEAFLSTNSGTIYGLSSEEIYKFNRNKNRLIPLHVSPDNFPAYTDMKEDSEGMIWIASGNLGLQKFNPADNSIKSVKDWSSYFQTGHKLPLFQEIVIDNGNRIWFRRRGESYGYYDPVKNVVNYFGKSEEALDITSFSDIVNDTLYVATANHEFGFVDTRKPEQGVHLSFSFKKLKIGLIEDIVVDHKNRIWCLTGKGLVRIDRKNRKHFLFDESFGIRIHDSWTNKNALIPGELKVLSDGSMVIGYRRGLGFFNPDSLQLSYPTPEPYFTAIMISGKAVKMEAGNVLKLKHDENYLSFGYSALDIYHEGFIFRHKLLGEDNEWVNNPQLNEASYTKLTPGNYTFTVEITSRSGFGDKKQVSLNFRILPPWWKTLWAYAGFLILISILLYILYQYQLKRQLSIRETKHLRELDELKTRLYANITHEFRTPITVIMGMTEELSILMDRNGKKEFSKKLETIERNSSNLLYLVNQMLDLAKLEHGKLISNPIQSNIIPWLQYMVESHQSLADAKEIRLTFYTETEHLIMDYDTDHLSKVISNLLTNAIKFTNNRGKVICHVKYNSAASQLHFKVKDNGIGIPETEHSHIFDRFYQVNTAERNNRSGTGIGLSLSKEIVEMIGGTISVKSRPGKGSEFEVIIPVTRNLNVKISEPDQFEKPFIKKEIPAPGLYEDYDELSENKEKPLVLIAEDNHDIATYIRDTIRLNYKVKRASDGEMALQMAFDLIPDIIISDVMMPGKDGFEVCHTLKQDERTNHIPIILLTAKVTDNDRISGYEQGADAYLTKPFNKKELLVRLEQLLKLRRQLQLRFGKLELRKKSMKPLNVEEQFIRKAIQIVENNMEISNFNAMHLAEQVHLSESQLYRKLKAISGKSTALFIRSVRLKIARELLESSSFSISEIAYRVGFNDPAWFSRVFKEDFGMSPSEAKLKR